MSQDQDQDQGHGQSTEQDQTQEQLSTSDIASRGAHRAETNGDEHPDEEATPLFSQDEGNQLRSRWTAVQTAFVDDPRDAVAQADSLVAETIQSLATSFSDQRGRLEEQWGRGENVSTEDLRVVLQRYRSFFNRLLNL
jgi:hypothetical protein